MERAVQRYLYQVIARKGLHLPPWLALDVLIGLAPVLGRRKIPSIRRLEKTSLRYYRQGLAAGNLGVWSSIFCPTELFTSNGMASLCLEGLAGVLAGLGVEHRFLDGPGAEAAPSTLCTFHRLLTGLGMSGVLPKPGLIVSASALCDGNGATFRYLAEKLGVPFVFLDVPADPTPDALAYLIAQLRALQDRIVAITGRPPAPDALAEAVRHSREAGRLAVELRRKRSALTRNLFHGHQLINFMFPLHVQLGNEALCQVLRALIRDVDTPERWCRDYPAPAVAPGALRLVWAHIAPVFNYNAAWAVIDDGVRSKIVLEEYSSWDLDPSQGQDEYEYIARRLIAVPGNGPLERRMERLLRICREAGADALIHFSPWGCHQAAGAIPLMQRYFTAHDLPFLNVNGDCVDSRNAGLAQHLTRYEAFLEALRRK